MKEKRTLQCAGCGKFISVAEYDADEVTSRFTPDTHFTYERMDFYHKRCLLTPTASVPNEETR